MKVAEKGEMGMVEREDEEKGKRENNSKRKKKWGRNHGRKGNSDTKNRGKTERKTERNGLDFSPAMKDDKNEGEMEDEEEGIFSHGFVWAAGK